MEHEEAGYASERCASWSFEVLQSVIAGDPLLPAEVAYAFLVEVGLRFEMAECGVWICVTSQSCAVLPVRK